MSIYFSSIIIILISGATLLFTYHVNKYQQVDRFFYYQNTYLYILFQLSYYLVFLSFVLNTRFLVFEILSFAIRNYLGFQSSSTSTS